MWEHQPPDPSTMSAPNAGGLLHLKLLGASPLKNVKTPFVEVQLNEFLERTAAGASHKNKPKYYSWNEGFKIPFTSQEVWRPSLRLCGEGTPRAVLEDVHRVFGLKDRLRGPL